MLTSQKKCFMKKALRAEFGRCLREDSVPQAKAAGNQGDEAKTEQESVGVAAPLGDHQRNVKDSAGK